jgi:hypothetical protein
MYGDMQVYAQGLQSLLYYSNKDIKLFKEGTKREVWLRRNASTAEVSMGRIG